MLVMFPCSRNIQILLLCSFFYTLCDFVQADPPYPLCSNSTVSADNTFFRNNLDNLLSSLSSNASISNLYNTTTGNVQETLYGLSFCYQYVSPDQCEKCISSAAQHIQKRCPYNSEAVVFEDDCQLRYSNKSFLGHLDTTGNIGKDNTENVTEPDRYITLVNGLLHDISRQAAWDPSAGMYATRELNFTETETIYALVQCTSDLSPDDCNTCLQTAIKNTSSCCSESRGARLYSRSCYLRYEFYAFYGGESGPNSSQIDYKSANSKEGTQKENWIIAALTIGSSILVIALVAAGVYCLATRSRTKPKEGPVAGGDFQNLQPMENLNSLRVPFINLATLIVATANFSDSNKLGQGGFGPVYKGQLPDGKEVAVKRLLCDSEQGVEEFTNEVLFILKLQHKNLVKLFGFCVDGEEKLLIYEYMPNGSLDTFLFDPNKRAQLHWHRRLIIINGIARGMLYLHEDSRLRIIHRDLKPSNILLDSEMTPKISDFGMARIFGGINGEANTAKIVGTYGYMAPEYAMEGLYSIKSDVFGFGVLLLEIVTGKRNAGFHLSKLAPNLLTYAWQLWNEGKGLELIDPLLKDSCDLREFLRYMQIGLLCVQEDAYDRPTMSTVVVMLKGEVVILSQPERPGFSMGRFVDYYETNDIYYSASGLTTSGTMLS